VPLNTSSSRVVARGRTRNVVAPERDGARPVGEPGSYRNQLPAVHALELDDPAAETVLPDGSVPPTASFCPALMTFLAATTDSVA
jgi:hypothetical protein